METYAQQKSATVVMEAYAQQKSAAVDTYAQQKSATVETYAQQKSGTVWVLKLRWVAREVTRETDPALIPAARVGELGAENRKAQRAMLRRERDQGQRGRPRADKRGDDGRVLRSTPTSATRGLSAGTKKQPGGRARVNESRGAHRVTEAAKPQKSTQEAAKRAGRTRAAKQGSRGGGT